MNRKAIDYSVLDREVQSAASYPTACCSGQRNRREHGLKTSNIRIVDRAERPLSL
jgi:hypothetical protein